MASTLSSARRFVPLFWKEIISLGLIRSYSEGMKKHQKIQLVCLMVTGAGLLLLGGCASTPGSDPISHEIYTGNYASVRAPMVVDRPDSLVVASYNIAFALETETAAEELLSAPGLSQVDILLLQEMDAGIKHSLIDYCVLSISGHENHTHFRSFFGQ